MTQDGERQPEYLPAKKSKSKAQGLRQVLTMMKFRPLRWSTLLIAASLLTLVFVSVFSLGLLPKDASSPLALAMVTTTSGPQASQGLEALRSVQLYINAVNQAGGVNGRPIQLQVFNDEFKPATAQQVARQIAASPSLLVLGPIYSAMALPVNSIYKDAHIPLITGTVSSDRLTAENPYAFRLRTPITSQGDMTAARSLA
jgi:branched-chain amino acid transport system substrate-binding protein